MRELLIIGIGAGDPEHMTMQAITALNRVDVFFIPDKGGDKAELRELRMQICERYITSHDYRMVGFDVPKRDAQPADYNATVMDWHARIGLIYRDLISSELSEGQCGGLLVWGDPSLYDSTLRIVHGLIASGFAIDVEVIPGITSVQALAAKHRIALHEIGEPVLITTGRKLGEAMPDDFSDLVVMLDGEQAFSTMLDDVDIYWGAYLGAPDEILISGRLIEVKEQILAARASARNRKGWMMDTYLLRKRR